METCANFLKKLNIFVHRLRPHTEATAFFVRLTNGKAVENPTKELVALQGEFGLPFLCSSNARHVVETAKGNAGLDVGASAGKLLVCKTVNRDCRII
jgi:hypothetical protein